MKELSIEEKSKRYDEALERAKEFVAKDNKEVAEYIFPELAESEDEKVRKGLVRLLKELLELGGVAEDEWDRNECEKYISWLEKQGEQKPEWSEEDATMLNDCVCAIQAADEVDYSIEDKDLLINWLKSIRPQKQEQWNEQDIEMIDWLIRCCEKEYEELCNDRYGHQEIVSDLKRDCRKKWDWLESLKSKVVPQKQWKPSEEQMRQLHKYCIDNKPLNELYEHLKAL